MKSKKAWLILVAKPTSRKKAEKLKMRKAEKSVQSNASSTKLLPMAPYSAKNWTMSLCA